MSLEEETEQLINPTETLPTFYGAEGRVSELSAVSAPSTNNAKHKRFKVYKRRWYILFMFVAMNITYNVYWNTIGPIQGPIKRIFRWKDWQILLMSSWAATSLIVASPPMGWLMEGKGLRTAVVISCAFLVIGKTLQALPFVGQTADTVLLNFGQFISFLSGPVSLGAPTLVSSSWFPPSERTTATAVGTQSSYVGLALAYFIGPYFVTDPETTSTSTNTTKTAENSSSHDIKAIEGQFKGYIYFQAALAVVVLAVVLIYFPSKPKLPPSHSSTVKRHLFSDGVKRLVTDWSFLLLAAMFGIQFGVVCGWLSILDVILSKFSVDQTTAGWLGCAATLAGALSGLLISRVADCMKRRTKHLLVTMLIGGTISQTFFTLTCEQILPFNKVVLFVCIILTGFFMISVTPLFFEIVVECTYPVPESITACFLMMVGNVILLVFYIIFMFPNMDVRWINWLMVGTIAVCVLGVSLYRERYTRLDLDTHSSSFNSNDQTGD